MTRKNELIDLCTNCLNIDHCSYYRNQKEPVIFCEEFTCKEPQVSLNCIESLNNSEKMSLSERNQGLCNDCGHRFDCKWDKKPSKLYCEEYE